jgi:hypothetical protein
VPKSPRCATTFRPRPPIAARLAPARGELGNGSPTTHERHVRAVHGVDYHRAVRLAFVVDEDGVALDLRDREVRVEGVDDSLQEVCEHVGRVLELDAGQVSRVAADVGDEQAAMAGDRHEARVGAGRRGVDGMR